MFNGVTVISFNLSVDEFEVLSFGPFPAGSFIRALSGSVGGDTAVTQMVSQISIGNRRLARTASTEFALAQRLDEPSAYSTGLTRLVIDISPVQFVWHVGRFAQPGKDVVLVRVGAVTGVIAGFVTVEVIPEELIGSSSHGN